MILNYFLDLGAEASQNGGAKSAAGDNERIKVTDATATGGWW